MKIAVVNVEALDPNRGAAVLNHCRKCFPFDKAILFAPEPPSIMLFGDYIRTHYMEYKHVSHFYMALANWIPDFDFAVIVHNDGYIIDGKNWRWEFLDYDYIGTPWKPGFPCKNRAGGGGFNIRSKKMMRDCIDLKEFYPKLVVEPHWGDDHFICGPAYEMFVDRGCRFPSIELAAKWGLEYEIPEVPYNDSQSFGFHKFTTPEREKYKELIDPKKDPLEINR